MKTLLVALMLALASPAVACEIGDLKLLQSEFHSRNGGSHGFFVTVVGELESSCDTRTIARVHLIWRDADGKVVGTRDTYVDEIPSHVRQTFEVPDITIREAKSMDSQITGVRNR